MRTHRRRGNHTVSNLKGREESDEGAKELERHCLVF